MATPPIRPIEPPDLGEGSALLALNNAHAAELGRISIEALRHVVGEAFCAIQAGAAAAMLIALDQDAAYDSPNFLWFKSRFQRFAYVDRIVVAPSMHGLGLGRALYGALFEGALAAGHVRVTCEVNIDPPNPGSDAFHAALGFVEVGRAVLAARGKTVRYLVRDLN